MHARMLFTIVIPLLGVDRKHHTSAYNVVSCMCTGDRRLSHGVGLQCPDVTYTPPPMGGRLSQAYGNGVDIARQARNIVFSDGEVPPPPRPAHPHTYAV